MGTTLDRAAVVAALETNLLARRSSLPTQRNGHPLAPSDPAAASLRKMLKQGRVNFLGNFVTVLACDVQDGVPVASVKETLDDIGAYLELVAASQAGVRAVDRSLCVLLRNETRSQGRCDLAEMKLAESITEDTLRDVQREGREHIATLQALVAGATKELAVVRATPRHVQGAGRLAVHR